MQGVFAFWQLQGTIEKHFGDPTLQVTNAARGAIHSHAGTGASRRHRSLPQSLSSPGFFSRQRSTTS